MAIETIKRFVDDIDGTEATGTVRFSYQGKDYEGELSDKNREKLEKALAPYLEKFRPARPSYASPAPARKTSGKADRGWDIIQLREWAGANGVTVPVRGRIPGAIVEAYLAAGGR